MNTYTDSRKQYFEDTLIKLIDAAKNGFDFLKKNAETEKLNVQGFLYPHTKEKLKYEVDSYSKTLFPSDENNQYVPIQVYGDGNCAYRSMSLHIFGTEKYYTEMRVRIAIELACHKDFYLYEAMGDRESSQFVRRLSQTTQHGGSHSLNKSFEMEVLQTCQKNSWAGIWQICAFASISYHPVKSIYPEKNRILRADLHHLFYPRTIELRDQEIYRIMWTRTQPSNDSWWTPNHFVPCINQMDLPTPAKATIKMPVFKSYSPTVRQEKHKRRTLTLADFLIKNQTKKQRDNMRFDKEKGGDEQHRQTLEELPLVKDGENERKEEFDINHFHDYAKTNTDMDNRKRNQNLSSEATYMEESVNTQEIFMQREETKDLTKTQFVPQSCSSADEWSVSEEVEVLTTCRITSDLKSIDEETIDAKMNLPTPAQTTIKMPVFESFTPTIRQEQHKRRTLTLADFLIKNPTKKQRDNMRSDKEKGGDEQRRQTFEELPLVKDGENERKEEFDINHFHDYAKTNTDMDNRKRNQNLSPEATNMEEGVNTQEIFMQREETNDLTKTQFVPQSCSSADEWSVSEEVEVLTTCRITSDLKSIEKETIDAKTEIKTEFDYEKCSKENVLIIRAEKRKRRSTNSQNSLTEKPGKPNRITSYFSKQPKTPSTKRQDDTCTYIETPKLKEKTAQSHPKQLFISQKNDICKASDQSTVKKEETTKSYDNIEWQKQLPLNVSKAWYKQQGEVFISNRSRSLLRDNQLVMEGNVHIGMQRSKKKGNLYDCNKELDEVLGKLTHGSQKYSHLLAVKKVCEEILYGSPILLTQKASEIYQTAKNEALKRNQEILPKLSIEIYEILSKYLSVMQVYFCGKAYLMEDRGSKLKSVVEEIHALLDSKNEQKIVNDHVQNQIGHLYKNALDYLDSERDRDTVTFLLTKVTSVNFMTKLENIKSRRRIKKALDIVLRHLKLYQDMIKEYKFEEGLSDQQRRCILRRVKELKKKEVLRHHMEGRGRMLKCEQNPNIVPVLEYEFGEGDVDQRGGGGMEAHSRLTNAIKYKTATNKTRMADARETILATGSLDFSISLSTCYNYTQNFKKGTYEAKRHHEGKGVNAMISLHRAPKTAVVKEYVINAHFCSANINYLIDNAAEDVENTVVDSKDAKAVVRCNNALGGKTWVVCEAPDHDWDQSRTNAITPMGHLFLETTISKISNPMPDQLSVQCYNETVLHVTRSGKAVYLLNLSIYEPETVFRCFNEIFTLLAEPSLDDYFRNPITGKLKSSFIFVVDNGPSECPNSPLVRMLLVRFQQYLNLDKYQMQNIIARETLLKLFMRQSISIYRGKVLLIQALFFKTQMLEQQNTSQTWKQYQLNCKKLFEMLVLVDIKFNVTGELDQMKISFSMMKKN